MLGAAHPIREDPRLERLREAALVPRDLKTTYEWWRRGRSGPAPERLKRQRIARTARSHGATTVVETGTYLGHTTAYLAARGFTVHTIELSPELAANARTRFRSMRNVHVWEGDSGAVLPTVLLEVAGPATFWLDGHYSGGSTARGAQDTPIVEELRAISRSPQRGNVVLVDDVHCFNGDEYIALDELLALARGLGFALVDIGEDILTLRAAS